MFIGIKLDVSMYSKTERALGFLLPEGPCYVDVFLVLSKKSSFPESKY